MTGKKRVLNAIKCIEVDRVPWVPFVGSHAASLLGVSAEEYFKSTDKIVEGANKAIELYKPDGIPVTFDLQIEAEVLGCAVKYAKDNPPAVYGHPLASGKTLSDLSIPSADEGRIKIVMDASRRIREDNPDIALYGLITGPFTLALHLLGTDIFMQMFEAPDKVLELLDFCADVGNAMSDYYIEAGCDIIAVVDPMTSQIGPEQFKQFVTPSCTKVFEHITKKGSLGSFFVCGHAQQNIEVMCDCKPDNVSIDENIPLDYVRDICVERGISFGGNLQLTAVLLLGTELDSQKDAIRCLDLGGKKGFILAPGCDLPYATPEENLVAITKVVTDPYELQVARTAAESVKADFVPADISYLEDESKVYIDCITLDSESCAPCQYLVDAVRKAAEEFCGMVVWKEHKIKVPEGIQMMHTLGVSNIPTTCIDGNVEFISRIPAGDELIEKINEYVVKKGLQCSCK